MRLKKNRASQSNVTSASISVLMAEDDPHDQMLFAMAAEDSENDLRPVFVDDGLDVLPMLRTMAEQGTRPDLIVLDMRMPRSNGHDVLSEIKADPLFADIDVVVFSSSRRQTDMNKSIEVGALWHEVKPSNYAELVAFVDAIAGRVKVSTSS